MLSKALETETRLAGEVLCDGRLKQLIDRLPTLFDAVEGEGEARSLVRFLELLLLRDAAISSSLTKVLPKLINRTCVLKKSVSASMETEEDEKQGMVFLLAVRLLTVVGHSSYQNLLMQSIDTIMSSCMQIRAWQDKHQEETSELFALALSLESPAAWEGVWGVLTDKAGEVLREYLDIDVGDTRNRSNWKESSRGDEDQQGRSGGQVPVKAAEGAAGALLDRLKQVREHGATDHTHFAGMVFSLEGLPSTSMSRKGKGKGKGRGRGNNGKAATGGGSVQAIIAHSVYEKLLSLLCNMLRAGCCTGPIEVDVSAIVLLNRSILSVSLRSCGLRGGGDFTEASARAILRGEKGVSPADTLLVAPSLKVHTLSLLRSLLALRLPALMKVAIALCEPIASLLASAEASIHPAVSRATLQTLTLLIEAFPAVIARRLKSVADTVVALFAAEVETLSREPSVTIMGDRKGGGGKGQNSDYQSSDATLPFSSLSTTTTTISGGGKESSSLCEAISALVPSTRLPNSITGISGTLEATVAGLRTIYFGVQRLYCDIVPLFLLLMYRIASSSS